MGKDVVKKVKPYPFPIEIKLEAATIPGHVIKLTPQGLMAQVTGSSLQPGDKIEVGFRTPVLDGHVQSPAVVVKVFQQLKGIVQLEIHFRSIPNESMSRVTDFLSQIGQIRR